MSKIQVLVNYYEDRSHTRNITQDHSSQSSAVNIYRSISNITMICYQTIIVCIDIEYDYICAQKKTFPYYSFQKIKEPQVIYLHRHPDTQNSVERRWIHVEPSA